MNDDTRKLLKQMLGSEEGYRQYLYRDTTGNITGGYGHNFDSIGISKAAANFMLDEDIQYHINNLSEILPVFNELSEARQLVLVNMCFNMGLNGLLRFTNMIDALEQRNYEGAAEQMLSSRWAEQVHSRANVLADIMRTGNVIQQQ